MSIPIHKLRFISIIAFGVVGTLAPARGFGEPNSISIQREAFLVCEKDTDCTAVCIDGECGRQPEAVAAKWRDKYVELRGSEVASQSGFVDCEMRNDSTDICKGATAHCKEKRCTVRRAPSATERIGERTKSYPSDSSR